jgi:hypothetical protein
VGVFPCPQTPDGRIRGLGLRASRRGPRSRPRRASRAASSYALRRRAAASAALACAPLGAGRLRGLVARRAPPVLTPSNAGRLHPQPWRPFRTAVSDASDGRPPHNATPPLFPTCRDAYG